MFFWKKKTNQIVNDQLNSKIFFFNFTFTHKKIIAKKAEFKSPGQKELCLDIYVKLIVKAKRFHFSL